LKVSSSDRGINGFIHLDAIDEFFEEIKVEIKALVVNKKRTQSANRR
jgi:hypothetical protein